MKLLAWDTSLKSGALIALEWCPESFAVSPEIRFIAELMLNVDTVHSERLLWGIHQVLKAARWELREVDYFGVGIGPGSFTGLRIGITTARTLAHTLNKPLVGVSSLAVLARPIALSFTQPDLKNEPLVLATTDACKGELFALWGRASEVACSAVTPDEESPGLWKKGVEERVITPVALMDLLQKQILGEWIAVGEGRERYPEEWQKITQFAELKRHPSLVNSIQGRYLGQVAVEAIQAGLARDALLIYPRYLRVSDAEIKLRAGLLAKAPVEMQNQNVGESGGGKNGRLG